jgi:P27 family predicted phage terminase small subunit
MIVKPPKRRPGKPPAFLRPATRAWWKAVEAKYELDDHHRLILTQACNALDRAQEARETLTAEGSYFTDRLGNKKAHPACAIELSNSRLFASLVRELGLDVNQVEPPRPPALPGYGGKS